MHHIYCDQNVYYRLRSNKQLHNSRVPDHLLPGLNGALSSMIVGSQGEVQIGIRVLKGRHPQMPFQQAYCGYNV